MTTKVKEGWLGPGRKDGKIISIKPEDDGLHIDMKEKYQNKYKKKTLKFI